MIILNGFQFEKKYGLILHHDYILFAEKEFLSTSLGAWLFTDMKSMAYMLPVEYRIQGNRRSCGCNSYSCFKCYLSEIRYRFNPNYNINVYTYMEIYKEILKSKSPSYVFRFKKTIMEVTDEQF